MKRAVLLALAIAMGGIAGRAQTTPPPAPELTIANIFRPGGLTGRAPETVKWSPDGRKVSYVLRDDSGEQGQLWYVDVSTGQAAVLVAQEKLATLEPPVSRTQNEREKERLSRYSVAGYHWAPDSRRLLFDSHGQLWLYSLDTRTAIQVTDAPEPASDPKFSPNGSALAYVRQHELFVRPLSTHGGERETQLTEGKDGRRRVRIQVNLKDEDQAGPKPGDILNGEVDWVYEEELDVRSNYFWSPDGAAIAYLQMDESAVPSYPIEDFIPTHATVDQEKYPKAGDPNPSVRVGVVRASGGGTRWISPTKDADVYIPRFGWAAPGVLYIETLNRAQNKLELYFADATTGRSRLVMTETSPSWIYPVPAPIFLKAGGQFLWQSWRDGHTHIYLYRFDRQDPLGADAAPIRQLTHGDFETFEIASVDETRGTVYFTANAGDPRQRQLWSAPLSGGEARPVSRGEGTHEVSFPENGGSYYVDTFSSLSTPPSMSVCSLDQGCTRFWEARSVTSYHLPTPKWVELKAADGVTTLYGTLLLPPDDVIARMGGKVPLLTNPYGGPGVQTVVNAWGDAPYFFNHLLARAGIAVLTVDNRGQAGRGRDFQGAILHHMGELPLADQLAALDQVFQQFPELDRNRLGWWGWSYGGYMTLVAMTHSERIKAGVAVAPVSDWRNYDSIYTERYLGLPKDQEDDYKRTAPVNFAAGLRGHLLEVHGTSDDNVHMQNTIQMVNAFIDAGKMFDLMLYPRKTHSIAGTVTRTDLFTRIQQHFERELLGSQQQESSRSQQQQSLGSQQQP